jgi:cysteinyl-tRNA synthetase
MHNGLVMVGGVKMSKSLGNFTTVKQALAAHEPEVIRLAILSSHYSSPLDFTEDLFRSAGIRLSGFYRTLAALGDKARSGVPGAKNPLKLAADALLAEFEAAMSDNLNTALALAAFSDAFRRANQVLENGGLTPDELSTGAAYFIETVRKISGILRILEDSPTSYLERARNRFLKERKLDVAQIQAQIAERSTAKSNKDYAAADRIRQELSGLGIKLEDKKESTTWDIDLDS